MIFLTKYFQRKNDLIIRISLFNQKVQGSILFIKKIGPFMNKMDEKKEASKQIFQAKCPREKGTFLGYETKW